MIPQLSPARLKGGEYTRNVWVAVAEQDHTREHFKHPTYWSHAAQRMKPYDHIEVVRDDGTLYAEYLVLEVGRGWANVFELRYDNLTSKDVAQTQALDQVKTGDYEVKFNGPHDRWIVIRKSDSQKINDKMANKEEANKWLEEHLKTIA